MLNYRYFTAVKTFRFTNQFFASQLSPLRIDNNRLKINNRDELSNPAPAVSNNTVLQHTVCFVAKTQHRINAVGPICLFNMGLHFTAFMVPSSAPTDFQRLRFEVTLSATNRMVFRFTNNANTDNRFVYLMSLSRLKSARTRSRCTTKSVGLFIGALNQPPRR